jgi:TRAP-type C4-dicarboxylate transport system substrate-binding protein
MGRRKAAKNQNGPLSGTKGVSLLLVPEVPLAVPLIESLKASAVPIGFGELYTALTTGLVDV